MYLSIPVLILTATSMDRSITRSFGAHERHYLSVELKPLLETLGGVATDRGGDGGERGTESASAMAFTRSMEEVRIDILCRDWVVFCSRRSLYVVVLGLLRIRIFTGGRNIRETHSGSGNSH